METSNEYYAAPAALPHQKGKWAVWKGNAQIQGTTTDSEDEAKAIAEGFNKSERKQDTGD